ncbi:MAG: GntR family transcriptional regulator [Planctomycetaceae bacterium]|nr:GntR family transcriptional regulator [Planctomycetaceae bacterium]
MIHYSCFASHTFAGDCLSPSLLFQIHPSSGVPIYRQLMDQVRTLVATGRLPADSMLPSVRQVADELQVNHMTVSKAWSLLEREGVIERVRGQGMKILPPGASGGNVRERLSQLNPHLQQLAAHAYQLRLTPEQVLTALKPLLQEPSDG